MANFDDDDDDLPPGWGDKSPPATPSAAPRPPFALTAVDSWKQESFAEGQSTNGQLQQKSSTKGLPSVSISSTLELNKGRKPLPLLFTNVPRDPAETSCAATTVSTASRPPRPPTKHMLHCTVEEGYIPKRRGRSRVASRTDLLLGKAQSSTTSPSTPRDTMGERRRDDPEALEVRKDLEVLRAKKKHCSLEETLDNLEALERRARSLRKAPQFVNETLPRGRVGHSLPPVSTSAPVSRASSCVQSAASSRGSSERDGSLPPLGSRRAASVPCRRDGLRLPAI